MSKKSTKYMVKLKEEQRSELLSMVNRGKQNARPIKRAQMLLLSDDGKTAAEIAEFAHTTKETVYNTRYNTRRKLILEGLNAALYDKPRPGAKRILNSKQEAHVIATACSQPPGDRARWTVRLLTDRIVELGIVDEISRETVRRTLKKTLSNRGRKSSGAYPV